MSSAAIVIVNWNTGPLLTKCLASIQALPEYNQVEAVIIIDNNSHDDSFARAKASVASDSKFSFVQSGENLGFARATNIGIRRVGNESNAHILLLNPDTEMQPYSLSVLLDGLESSRDTGVIGPKLVYPNGEHQASVRRFPTPFALLFVFLKLQHIIPENSIWQRYIAADFDYSKEQDVEQIMGACFLIRREVLQQIDLLDERFWIWFEEVDFCKRSISRNWRVHYMPESVVVHYGGVSFHQLVGLKKSWPFIRSALLYARKHFSLFSVALLYLVSPITIGLSIIAAFKHKIDQAKNKKNL